MRRKSVKNEGDFVPHLIRRSQSISPFGVGAIIDQSGESFVFTDITFWQDSGERIDEPRLRDFLGVDHFRAGQPAPNDIRNIDEKTRGIPVVRFPFWHFCPNCKRMDVVASTQIQPSCRFCSDAPPLVPMRLVMACAKGHLSDVPWIQWAHYDKGKVCANPAIYFETEPGGSGLEYVKIKCKSPGCNAEKSLKGIFTQDSLKVRKGEIGPIYCSGYHPWRTEVEKCSVVPKVVQRGATNLIYHKIESSIDIPPFSREDYYDADQNRIAAHIMFPAARAWFEEGDKKEFERIVRMIATKLKIDENQAVELAYLAVQPKGKAMYEDQVEGSPPQAIKLQWDEYRALLEPDGIYGPKDHFAKATVNFSDYPMGPVDKNYRNAIDCLKALIGSIVRVTKLREVRVLVGFSRLAPPMEQDDAEGETPGLFPVYGQPGKIPAEIIPPDLGAFEGKDRWLPAIEVFGEGIFITLNMDSVRKWEVDEKVKLRYEKLSDRRDAKAKFLPKVTPRLILLHTISHALIRRLSFDCGYALASLRERIYSYVSDQEMEMAGVLIYTAAGDVEGTLGGLVRQGRPERIFPTFLAAIQDTIWCSSDPLCRESRGQGPDSCNLAACHACSLIPETACTMSNRLLDRMSLIARPDEVFGGYFSPLVDILENI